MQSIKVTYRAGYSPAELQGRATANETAGDGTITQSGVNASGILRAALMTAVKSFHTWVSYQKDASVGFVGPKSSESLGEYSYSGGHSGQGFTDLTIALPSEAIEELAPFVNYGRMRL